MKCQNRECGSKQQICSAKVPANQSVPCLLPRQLYLGPWWWNEIECLNYYLVCTAPPTGIPSRRLAPRHMTTIHQTLGCSEFVPAVWYRSNTSNRRDCWRSPSMRARFLLSIVVTRKHFSSVLDRLNPNQAHRTWSDKSCLWGYPTLFQRQYSFRGQRLKWLRWRVSLFCSKENEVLPY